MTTSRAFLATAAVATLVLACSPNESAVERDNTAPSRPTGTQVQTTSNAVSTTSTTTTLPGVTWAQFDAYFGGDLVDPCGVNEGSSGFEPKVTPPYLGSEGGFYGSAAPYVIGDEFEWCVYGFDVGVPIEVTVTAPDDTQDRFRVVLGDGPTSECQSVDDDCWEDRLRHLFSPTSSLRTFFAESSMVWGSATAAMGGWVLPGTPPGRYLIRATQGSTQTSHVVDVGRASAPAIDVGTWIDGSGRTRHTALLVGFEPNADVPLALYRLEGRAPPAPWVFHKALGAVAVDEHGEAVWTFETPADVQPGQHCVLAAETIPREGAESWMDPCHFLAQFDASIEVEHDLAGVWRIDNWQIDARSVVPTGQSAEIPAAQWTITADRPPCIGDQCELDVRVQLAGGAFPYDLRLKPSADGWVGSVEEEWNCLNTAGFRTDRASIGQAVYTVRPGADFGILDVTYAYDGTETEIGSQECTGGPITSAQASETAVLERG